MTEPRDAKKDMERMEKALEMAGRRIEALQQLLICYRIGRQPTEKLFAELECTKKGWEEIEQALKQPDPE